MSAVAFICPFCKDGQTVIAGDSVEEIDAAFVSHEEPYCTQFADVVTDKLQADEFLRLCRIRMSE